MESRVENGSGGVSGVISNRRCIALLRSLSGGVLAATLLIGTSASPLVGVQPVPQPVQTEAAPDPTPNQLRAATMRKMMRRITITFEGNRLEDVLKFFEEVAGIQIEKKWLDDRHATGLDKDFEVNLKIENMPLVNALERVLDRAIEDDLDRATWQLNDWGEVEVGPRSRLNFRKYIRIYDVQDLLFTIRDYDRLPNFDLGGGGEGGGGGGFFDDPDNDPGNLGPSEREQVERLVNIIQTFIEEDQWVANGGDGGTIRFFRGNLIIRCPDYMHRALSGYNFRVPEDYRPYRRPSETPQPGARPGRRR